MPHRHLLVLAVACLMGTAACGDDPASPGTTGDRPTIVATTSILGDVVRHVAGDQADVQVIMGVGVDPHDFQASARDIARVHQADLVVANGGGLEGELVDAIEGAKADGVPVLEMLDHVDPLPMGEIGGRDATVHDEPATHDDDDDGADHAHGSEDPHYWQDPSRMALGVEAIGAALERTRPGLGFASRAATYAAEIRDVDADIAALLDEVPEARRKLVTDHDAFGYFAEHYGYTLIGVIIPGGGTSGEASAASLAGLADTIEASGVTAVFAENTVSPQLAEALADEVGDDVTVVTLFSDALGEAGSGAATYLEMMRTNAEKISAALR